MERRSEARTGFGAWLEHLAWHAAAMAAVAALLLVLLGSLTWLDALAAAGAKSSVRPAVSARVRTEAASDGAEGTRPILAGGEARAGEACAPGARGAG